MFLLGKMMGCGTSGASRKIQMERQPSVCVKPVHLPIPHNIFHNIQATMSQTKAVVVVKQGEATVQSVSIPKLRDDYILIKVKAVALNPTDVS